MKILLTAFEPFNNDMINPSMEVLNEIDDIDKILLPVSYVKAKEMLSNKIREVKPDFILSLGYAGSRDRISIERYAYNETRASIPDNDGLKLDSGEVLEGGINVLETKCNIDYIINNTKEFNTYISNDPGRFICNEVYYLSLYLNNNKALFIHLPNMKNMNDNLKLVKKVLSFIE